MKAGERPYFHCWNNPKPVGKSWAFGWITGMNKDLICIYPDIQTRIMEHWTLSPTNHNCVIAFLAFLAKRFLFTFDDNLKGLKG